MNNSPYFNPERETMAHGLFETFQLESLNLFARHSLAFWIKVRTIIHSLGV